MKHTATNYETYGKTDISSVQDKIDSLETKTDGYTLFIVGLDFDILFTETIYRDQIYRYKSFAMNPGRSYNLRLTVPFQF